ncbi:MAG TPA: hypothetical protein VFO86_15200 [Terriglobia bacterium]|nr:hypothetical protein [Terriglobia bacterium]
MNKNKNNRKKKIRCSYCGQLHHRFVFMWDLCYPCYQRWRKRGMPFVEIDGKQIPRVPDRYRGVEMGQTTKYKKRTLLYYNARMFGMDRKEASEFAGVDYKSTGYKYEKKFQQGNLL